jgi:drug/metabolite transporter (DMT)-like permease
MTNIRGAIESVSTTKVSADDAQAKRALVAFLCGSALLSFGPLLVRLAQSWGEVSPLASAFWRLAIGFPALLVLIRLWPAQAMPKADVRLGLGAMALAGAYFAADLAVWHEGIVRTALANASLFSNLASLLLALYGLVILRQVPSRVLGIALGCAAFGAALLLGQSVQVSTQTVVGDALCFAAAVFYTAYLLVIAKLRGSATALGSLAGATLFGALFLLPLAVWQGGLIPTSAAGWVPLIALAIGSQVLGQGLIVYAFPHLSPVVSGLGLLIQPVISGALGWSLYGETMTGWELLGAGFIVAALMLIRFEPTPSRPQR